MLILKPRAVARSVAGAKRTFPSSHFHCAGRFDHPRTCTHVRLLGPCFKTGRMTPFSQYIEPSQRQVQLQMFTSPRESLHVHRVLPANELPLTYKARNITQPRIVRTSRAYAATVPRHPGTQQSRQDSLVPFASLSAISGTSNSLFKVLFIFPSWYLFAIGLKQIFSFG